MSTNFHALLCLRKRPAIFWLNGKGSLSQTRETRIGCWKQHIRQVRAILFLTKIKIIHFWQRAAYYLPPSSVLATLTTTSKKSLCEWKGLSTYYSISRASETIKDRIWSYDNPTEGFEPIRGYLSFYAGPWDCYVDGELVRPQPGDFYGGWLTDDIEGTVKGGPGTWGWWMCPNLDTPKSHALKSR